MTIHRVDRRLHYLNSSIEVVQRLPAGADDWFLAGGAPMPIAVYNVREGGSLAGSYVNVVNPGTFDAAPGVAPTWSGATGWGLNGTTQYLTTGITPASGWCMVLRYSDFVIGAGGQSPAGCRNIDGERRFGFRVQGGGFGVHQYQSGGSSPGSPALSSGVLGLADNQGYLNGVADGGTISPWTSPNNGRQIIIGAYNNGSGASGISPIAFFPGNILYLAIYDTSTDHATWMPAVSAAVMAL